ncbi:hypothetical protein SAMN02745174_02514 [Cetobacterium ceti]|uniref:HTH cro/C1-type domain-containing protein n=1 Tax=Cetobacterium ceti TaxID=180163 RepID=A0A1T4QYM5_9FUSO|nr:hypothetical protein [Cetobacterium ceti]SKA08813.1 hypothetical protein SAMN02745174_02514 [Cetobacterium ceti]
MHEKHLSVKKSDIENFNKELYKRILKIMEEKETNTYDLARKFNTSRSSLNNKLLRLNSGNGISTSSLKEISFMLDVPVYLLIAF